MKRLILAVLVAAIPSLHLAATGGQAPVTPTAAPPAPAKPASRPTPAQAPAPVASHAPVASAFGVAEQNAMVKQYCVGCHSDRGKAGGLTLASFDVAKSSDQLVLTEKMIRKLRAQMMPPAGARRPEADQILALASDCACTSGTPAASRPTAR